MREVCSAHSSLSRCSPALCFLAVAERFCSMSPVMVGAYVHTGHSVDMLRGVDMLCFGNNPNRELGWIEQVHLTSQQCTTTTSYVFE